MPLPEVFVHRSVIKITLLHLFCCTTPRRRRRRRVLLEKMIIAQLVKKSPSLYGARRFITVFTTARH